MISATTKYISWPRGSDDLVSSGREFSSWTGILIEREADPQDVGVRLAEDTQLPILRACCVESLDIAVCVPVFMPIEYDTAYVPPS